MHCELHYACVQGCAVARAPPAAVPSGRLRWHINPSREWDTAIGCKGDDNDIRDIRGERRGNHWMATTFRVDKEYITIGNVHMPTSWAAEDVWLEEMTHIEKHSEDITARFGHRTQVWVGDWNVGLDDNMGNRNFMLLEFISHASHKGHEEIGKPTLRWRHPGGRIIQTTVDAAFCTPGASSWSVGDESRRSDHSIAGCVRRGRKGFHPSPAADSRPWVCRQRAWRSTSWRQQQIVRADLARALNGARCAGDVQAALTEVSRRIKLDQGEGDRDDDEQFDELRGKLNSLRLCREDLRYQARVAREPARAKLGRAEWRIRLRMAKVRMRLRLRESSEGGGAEPGGVMGMFRLFRVRLGAIPAPLRRPPRLAKRHRGMEDNHRLLQGWEAAAAVGRSDGIRKSPLSTCGEFAECRRSKLAAPVGRGDVPHGLLLELRAVNLQTIFAVFERRLRGQDSDRLDSWIDSTLSCSGSRVRTADGWRIGGR